MTTSRPRVTVPRSGSWSPLMISSSVVLPAPLGPTMAIRRPATIWRPTPEKMCWAACVFDTPARVTRLMGGNDGTRRPPGVSRVRLPTASRLGSIGDEAGSGGVEAEPGRYAGEAARVPCLLDGVRRGGRVADREHRRAGAREAGAGRTTLVGEVDQLGDAGEQRQAIGL